MSPNCKKNPSVCKVSLKFLSAVLAEDLSAKPAELSGPLEKRQKSRGAS